MSVAVVAELAVSETLLFVLEMPASAVVVIDVIAKYSDRCQLEA